MNNPATDLVSNTHKGSAAAVLVAAGSSSRMNGEDKIFLDLCSRPVIEHSLSIFMNSGLFLSTILVVSEETIAKAHDLLSEYVAKGLILTTGGKRRQDSVFFGLEKIYKASVVAIHDGARPCVTEALLKEGLQKLSQTPQFFSVDLIKKAHKEISENVTDDASMIEMMGGEVEVFDGDPQNLKITTFYDIAIAQKILEVRKPYARK